jgi:hypothetical protein
MAEIDLNQNVADMLIAMEKHRLDDREWNEPALGGSICIPLASPDGREAFLLDISRGRIDLCKGTYQDRARNAVVLVRLDFGGQPHRNPDGQEVSSPHLHLYREGYGDKWAFPVPANFFPDVSVAGRALDDFMAYCKITRPPRVNRGLFA